MNTTTKNNLKNSQVVIESVINAINNKKPVTIRTLKSALNHCNLISNTFENEAVLDYNKSIIKKTIYYRECAHRSLMLRQEQAALKKKKEQKVKDLQRKTFASFMKVLSEQVTLWNAEQSKVGGMMFTDGSRRKKAIEIKFRYAEDGTKPYFMNYTKTIGVDIFIKKFNTKGKIEERTIKVLVGKLVRKGSSILDNTKIDWNYMTIVNNEWSAAKNQSYKLHKNSVKEIINRLQSYYEISEITIKRNLEKLEKQNHIKNTFGNINNVGEYYREYKNLQLNTTKEFFTVSKENDLNDNYYRVRADLISFKTNNINNIKGFEKDLCNLIEKYSDLEIVKVGQ